MCSETKGADQLCGNHTAELRLCFRICKKPVFAQRGSDNSAACQFSFLLQADVNSISLYFSFESAYIFLSYPRNWKPVLNDCKSK